MTTKTKGHTDCHQVTSITAFFKSYFTLFANRLKPVVLTLVTWGLCPICLAEWVVRCGEHYGE